MTETITEILKAHAGGRKLTETIEAVYARIEAHDDPALFLALKPKDQALEEAARVQAEGAERKPLYGVPYAIKDNIDMAGLPTTAACPAFAYQPQRSAFVVERLERAGAIAIGKTNLDQFATGLVGVRSPYGVPRNALRPDLAPGGSSAGSATAVGAGLVPFSLGTDTAGSGRVPAAMNGIVGLKPTLGALSTTGVVPACRTLDTVSIFALDVADAFLAFSVAQGYDEADAYSRKWPASVLSGVPNGLRLGVPRADQLSFFGDAAAEQAFSRDVEAIRALGVEIVAFDFTPFATVAALLYEGPWVAERYVATKPLIETHPDALHPITRRIIEGARKFDAASAFEATYRLANLRRATQKAWALFDVMLVPTAPRLYTIDEVAAEPLLFNSRLGTYTNFVNLLDLAAIAAPSGMRADGLPSSVTLIGAAGADGLLAGLGAAIQAQSGAPMGATGRLPMPSPASAPKAAPGRLEIIAFGAHLTGLPLNRELVELGGAFVRTVETTPDYRLYALPGTKPPKPGLVRVGDGEGGRIEGEIWSLGPAEFGAFVNKIPLPLGVGVVRLADGSSAQGFLCESVAARGANDVTEFGGWRAYVKSL